MYKRDRQCVPRRTSKRSRLSWRTGTVTLPVEVANLMAVARFRLLARSAGF